MYWNCLYTFERQKAVSKIVDTKKTQGTLRILVGNLWSLHSDYIVSNLTNHFNIKKDLQASFERRGDTIFQNPVDCGVFVFEAGYIGK